MTGSMGASGAEKHHHLLADYRTKRREQEERARRAERAASKGLVLRAIGRRSVERLQQRAAEAALAAQRARDELVDRWTSNGDDLQELELRLREIEFSAQVRALYAGPMPLSGTSEYDEAVRRQKAAVTELQEFWVSAGHDLRELDSVLWRTDVEVGDLFGK